MGRTIKIVFEKGVFRPLEPVFLDEGMELELSLPFEPRLCTAEERAQTIRECQEAFAEFTDEEWADIKADILGPERMAARHRQEEEKK
jgi:predicted DNA-binding antitoxin AbrB/MazE fold protein